MRKYFGTDGVRGVANTELSGRLAYYLGRAGAFVLKKYSRHKKQRLKVVIGSDTRQSKDMLKSSLAAGLMSVGADVIDAGILPTPGVAYLTREWQADLGVVISASHNPMEYNGIKFFDSHGLKLADAIEAEIEEFVDSAEKLNDFPTHGAVGRFLPGQEAESAYIDFLKNSVEGDLKEMKIVLDTANGAAYRIAPKVFEALGAQVICIANEPDGTNINLQCGSTDTKKLQERVLSEKADLGLAFDGDADRLIAVDERGKVVDGDKIMLICAIALKEKKCLSRNALVVTVMSNIGLYQAAKRYGIEVVTTDVGDRYVLEKMLENKYSLGGEQSGHMIFLDYNTTGDGVLSGLKLAEILSHKGKKLSELSEVMETYPQVLVNARVKNENKNAYRSHPQIQSQIAEIEKKMDGQGRVLIRPSGTEPLVRVMIEGKDTAEITAMAKELAERLEECFG